MSKAKRYKEIGKEISLYPTMDCKKRHALQDEQRALEPFIDIEYDLMDPWGYIIDVTDKD